MTLKTLRISTIVIFVLLASIIGWSIALGNVIIPIIAVMVAIGLKIILNRATKEVMQDERTKLLRERAASVTIGFLVPIIGVGSVIIIALQEHLPDNIVSISYALAYVSCAFLVTYSVLYSYYSRKH